MKKQVLIATMLTAVAMFAGGAYAAEQTACVSTTNSPSIDSPASGSIYNWGFDEGSTGTDWTITPNDTEGTSVTIEWLKKGNYTLWSQETNAQGCKGPQAKMTISVASFEAITVQPYPICSKTDEQPDVVAGIELPTNGKCGSSSYNIDKWFIKSINLNGVTAGFGNKQAEVELTSNTDLANETFKNTTGSAADVVYTIIPYAGSIEGSEFTISLTVYPVLTAPKIIW